MSDDNVYKDGDIVWAKLGNNWWPAEVTDQQRAPKGFFAHLKRKPYCVVKFFNEDAFEYVRSAKQIHPYQCAKKKEFIKRGLSLHNNGNKFMEKFPSDVDVAEQLTRLKDGLIINDRPDSIVKAVLSQPLVGSRLTDAYFNKKSKLGFPTADTNASAFNSLRKSGDSITKIINLTPKNTSTCNTENETRSQHQDVAHSDYNSANNAKTNVATTNSSPQSHRPVSSIANSNLYQCNLCDFTSVRQNVMILHRKVHNGRSKISPTSTITSTLITTCSNSNSKFCSPNTANTNKQMTSCTTDNCNVLTEPKNPKLVQSNQAVQTQSEYPNHKTLSFRHQSTHSNTTLSNNTRCVSTSLQVQSDSDILTLKTDSETSAKRRYSHIARSTSSSSNASCKSQSQIEENLCNDYNRNKHNSEDIRKILLADWSDGEDAASEINQISQQVLPSTPFTNSNNTLKQSEIAENTSLHSLPAKRICITDTNASEITSRRIRNIPKKDRRDVVLRDFNSDITESNCSKSVNRKSSSPIVVQIDSGSNHSDSLVEIVENNNDEKDVVIVIADDECDLDNVDKAKNIRQSNNESETNSMPHSEASYAKQQQKNSDVLSCFDFQDDEENDYTSIAEFKKQCVDDEQLQTKISEMDKKHMEVAQKDQQLSAEIETLLQQTVPAIEVTKQFHLDSMHSELHEDSEANVKGLPIKERGKRIFKSRNRSRIEEMDCCTESIDKAKTNECHPNGITNRSVVILESIVILSNNNNNNNPQLNKKNNESDKHYDEQSINNSRTQEPIISSRTTNQKKNSDNAAAAACSEFEEKELVNNKQLMVTMNAVPGRTETEYIGVKELSNISGKTSENVIPDDMIISTAVSQSTAADEPEKARSSKAGQKLNESSQIRQITEPSGKQIESTNEKDINHEQNMHFVNEEQAAVTSHDSQEAKKISDIYNEPPTDKLLKKDTGIVGGEHSNDNDGNFHSNFTCDSEEDSKTSTGSLKLNNRKSERRFDNCNEIVLPPNKENEILHKTVDAGDTDDIVDEINPANCETIQTSMHTQLESTAYRFTEVSEEEKNPKMFDDHEVTTSSNDIAHDMHSAGNTSPTDESSSLAASDTYAEFGSPASMLDEERIYNNNRSTNTLLQIPATTNIQTDIQSEHKAMEKTYENIFDVNKFSNHNNFLTEIIQPSKESLCVENVLSENTKDKQQSIEVEKELKAKGKTEEEEEKIQHKVKSGVKFGETTNTTNSLSTGFSESTDNILRISEPIKLESDQSVSLDEYKNSGFSNTVTNIDEKINELNALEETEKHKQVNRPGSISSRNSPILPLITTSELTSIVTRSNTESKSPQLPDIRGFEKSKSNENLQNLTDNTEIDRTINDITLELGTSIKKMFNSTTDDQVEHPGETETFITDERNETEATKISVKSGEEEESAGEVKNRDKSIKTNGGHDKPSIIKLDLENPETKNAICDHTDVKADGAFGSFKDDRLNLFRQRSLSITNESENISNCFNTAGNDINGGETENNRKINTRIADENSLHKLHDNSEFSGPDVCMMESDSQNPIDTLDVDDIQLAKRSPIITDASDDKPVNEFATIAYSNPQENEQLIFTQSENAAIVKVIPGDATNSSLSENEPQQNCSSLLDSTNNESYYNLLSAEVTMISPPVREEIVHSEITQRNVDHETQVPIAGYLNTLRTSPDAQTNAKLDHNTHLDEEFLIEFDNIVNSQEHQNDHVEQEVVICSEESFNNIIEEDSDLLTSHNTCEKMDELNNGKGEIISLQQAVQLKEQKVAAALTNRLTVGIRRKTITNDGIATKKIAIECGDKSPLPKDVQKVNEQNYESFSKDMMIVNSNKPQRISNTDLTTTSMNQPKGIRESNTSNITLTASFDPADFKRKMSVEDNIRSFVIERPKSVGSLSSSSQINVKSPISSENQSSTTFATTFIPATGEIISLPKLVNKGHIKQEFIQTSMPNTKANCNTLPETARVIHQQIIHPPRTFFPAKSSIQQKRLPIPAAANSKTKQIGIDSRGNKCVIIKTTSTDVAVQPQFQSTSPSNNNASGLKTDTSSTFVQYKQAGSSLTRGKKNQGSIITLPKPITLPQTKTFPTPVDNAEKQLKSTRTNKLVAPRRKPVLQKLVSTTNSEKHKQAVAALSRRLSMQNDVSGQAMSSKKGEQQIGNCSIVTGRPISTIAQQQLLQLQRQQQQQQNTMLHKVTKTIANDNQQQHGFRKVRKSTLNRVATKMLQLPKQQQQQQYTHQYQQQQQQQQQMHQQLTAQHTQIDQHHSLQNMQQKVLATQQMQQQQQHYSIQQDFAMTTTQPADFNNGQMQFNEIQVDDSADQTSKILAVPTQPIPGYNDTFVLCTLVDNVYKPIDNVPLYLNQDLNQLVPVPMEALKGDLQLIVNSSNLENNPLLIATNDYNKFQDNSNINNELLTDLPTMDAMSTLTATVDQANSALLMLPELESSIIDAAGHNNIAGATTYDGHDMVNNQLMPSNNAIILSIDGQQMILDSATLAQLLGNNDESTQLFTEDGTEIILTREVLDALQMQYDVQNAEMANAIQQQQQQLLEMQQVNANGNGMISVSLNPNNLCDGTVLGIDGNVHGFQLINSDGIIFQPNITLASQGNLSTAIQAKVSETNALLNQTPIMSTLETPSSLTAAEKMKAPHSAMTSGLNTMLSTPLACNLDNSRNLEESLAAIGVTTQASTLPASLDLPITVTNPNIAPKVNLGTPSTDMVQFAPPRSITTASPTASRAMAAISSEVRLFHHTSS